MTKHFAILGSPVDHSKSPLIHSAAYRALGESWQYGRVEVAKGQLRKFIESSDIDYRGFSVTMPLKEDAYRFAQTKDERAELTKVVNTLLRDEAGVWHGYNTDVFGIIKAIENQDARKFETVLLIGSGSTAYSAMTALKTVSPNAVVKVFARNRKAKKQLIAFGKQLGLQVQSTSFLIRACKRAELTISAVPAHSLDKFFKKYLSRPSFKPGGMLLDVTYVPWPSVPAKLFLARGLKVASGLDMLIWQAVAQVRIFKLGNPALTLPDEAKVIDAMKSAVSQAL